MSDSFGLHRLWPTSFLCPWDFPGKDNGEDSCFLFQDIFSNPEIRPLSLASPTLAGGFFTTTAIWEALVTAIVFYNPKFQLSPN